MTGVKGNNNLSNKLKVLNKYPYYFTPLLPLPWTAFREKKLVLEARAHGTRAHGSRYSDCQVGQQLEKVTHGYIKSIYCCLRLRYKFSDDDQITCWFSRLTFAKRKTLPCSWTAHPVNSVSLQYNLKTKSVCVLLFCSFESDDFFSQMLHISKRETVVYNNEEDWLVFIWHVHDDGYGTSMTA